MGRAEQPVFGIPAALLVTFSALLPPPVPILLAPVVPVAVLLDRWRYARVGKGCVNVLR